MLELTSTLGFSLQRLGCFEGLNVKNPAEKMWVPCLGDWRWSKAEEADAATEQWGRLLLISSTKQLLIFLTCFPTEKGKLTLNSPCLFVFTS